MSIPRNWPSRSPNRGCLWIALLPLLAAVAGAVEVVDPDA